MSRKGSTPAACGRGTDVDIGPDETAAELRVRLVDAGTQLLLDALRDGLAPARPQQGEVTYAHKITPDDLALDWARPALDLHRLVRVGGAHTTFRGRRLKVWRTHVLASDPAAPVSPGELVGTTVGTGDGRLELLEVQPEGRGRQAAADWSRGLRPPPSGERLGA